MTRVTLRRSVELAAAIAFLLMASTIPAAAQRGGGGGGGDNGASGDLPTIEEKTADMEKLDGFLPLYWDADLGQLWMEIPELDQEMIHFAGFGAGLGSNDIGLDRGALRGSRIVEFERVGRKIMMVQPNYRFRAITDNPSEVKAVRDAFARSVLWGFTAAAETDGRVLVDMTGFLIRDALSAGDRMGGYRLDNSRSSVYMDMTDVFPTNTELEVELTFVSGAGGGRGGGGRGGRGGGGFEGVGSVASSGEAATIRVHHSFFELPDDDYQPRAFDSRSGYGSSSFQDYAVPLGEDMTQRFIRRHRLEKVEPNAAMSDPVEPIIYYLDPGTPEPVRSALLDGARWWNQAFEAAGYRDAFQVVIRPDSISSLDARYNVINWVHRSTRGWSTGGSVSDPRTGEIIKGVVTLGSLRVRQDYMMAEGLLSPYAGGDETPPELAVWALARIRQLAAHEVGHTIGLGHNYYNSSTGRISVLDYPHPLVTVNADGSLDHSDVYDVGIGEWDKVAVAYGYQDFPAGTNEEAALQGILQDAWDDDVRYMTGQDVGTTPQADQWANGTDMGTELDRMMDVRAAGLAHFGEAAIQNGTPMAKVEEVLVPLYMYHRYQVESTVTAVGGVGYVYATRGDGLTPHWRIPADAQGRAMDALMRTLSPSELALPESILALIPPRPPGFGRSRETFPRYTGGAFDALTPAVVAASTTINGLLTADRAARMVEQSMFDSSLPGLDDVLGRLIDASFGASANSAYEREVKHAVEGLVIERIKWLAANAPMLQVRTTSTAVLQRMHTNLMAMNDSPQAATLALDVQRFLERPATPVGAPNSVAAPPGAPIGDPGATMDRTAGPGLAQSRTVVHMGSQRLEVLPLTPIPVLDGHNDTLTKIRHGGPHAQRSFLERNEVGHLDLPRAREGGLVGGFFAIFTSSPDWEWVPGPLLDPDGEVMQGGRSVPLPAKLARRVATSWTLSVMSDLFRLEAESEGEIEVVRTSRDLRRCLADGTFAVILHIEGAEAIDRNLETLDVFYEAGLRSLGPVWSRPTIFGHGVPFDFPRSPDTGPGLTPTGCRLVRRCNELGVLLDLSHLNEKGFWDVARLSSAPLVATHSSAWALSPTRATSRTNRSTKSEGAGGSWGSTTQPRSCARSSPTAKMPIPPSPRSCNTRAMSQTESALTTWPSVPTSTARPCRTTCTTSQICHACSRHSGTQGSTRRKSSGSRTGIGCVCSRKPGETEICAFYPGGNELGWKPTIHGPRSRMVLRKASEIEESEGSSGSGGLSMDDLHEIAREVGIAPEAIAKAVERLAAALSRHAYDASKKGFVVPDEKSES